MDELAVALGMDPIALRIHNEPEVDPESGHPFSTHGLAECLEPGHSASAGPNATRRRSRDARADG